MLTAAVIAAAILPTLFLPVTTTRLGSFEDVPNWNRTSRPEATRVVVTNSNDVYLVLNTPTLTFPEVFDPELATSDSPGVQWDANTGRLQVAPGGSLVIEGVFGDLVLEVPQQQRPVVVITQTTTTGGTREWRIDGLEMESGEPSVALIPSPTSVLSQQRPLFAQELEVGLDSSVAIGPRVVDVSDGRVSVTSLAKAAAFVVFEAWALLGLACLVLLVAWLAGRAILPDTRADAAAPVATGLSLGFVLVNTLAYWLPMRIVAAVAGLAFAVLVAGRLLTHTSTAYWAVLRTDLPRLSVSLAIILIPTSLAFWPIWVWGRWFGGGYKTDLYEYASLSSLLQQESMWNLRESADAQASGNVTSGAGFVWRSIDSAAASWLSSVFGLSTLTGFVVLALALFMVYGLAAMSLARAVEGPIRRALAVIVLLNPLLPSLFLENYVSQYFFLALIPPSIVVLGFAWSTRTLRPSHTWAVAATAAALLSVYPYFAAVLAASFAAILLMRPESRSRMRRAILPIAGKTLLLMNLAILTVVNYGQTRVFEEGLDAIARNTLLSGWGRLEFSQFLLGIRSYHWRVPVQPTDGLDPSLLTILETAQIAVSPTAAFTLLSLASLVVIIAGMHPHLTRWSLEGRLLLAAVGGFASFGLLYGVLDRPYVSLKALWAAAALAPIVLIVAHYHRRGWTGGMLCGAIMLGVAWALTLIADRTAWLLPLESSWTRSLHLSSVPGLSSTEQLLSSAGNGDVQLTRGQQPLLGSDRDRVVAAFTVVLVRDEELDCLNCEGNTIPEFLDCHSGPIDSISVGVDSRVSLCGARTRVDEAYQSYFAAVGESQP